MKMQAKKRGRKAGVVTIILGKIDFQTKAVTRDKGPSNSTSG